MPDPLPPTVLQAGGVPIATAPDPDAPRFGPPVETGEIGTLGPYRVQKLLGKGGMGAVYLALDEGLRRQVALKVMLPRFAADADSNERFRREARAAAAVRHDNVVTMYQVGEDRGTPFIAMELLTGYPLDDYLKRKGRLTVAQALRVGTETALGLSAAHTLGLIHRDIKPANLWLEAPQGRIKILDFGLAKPAAATPDATELTGAGAVMGTPAYMSPEQARGEKADARADLFSLGVVLYQLTTGRRPFDRATAMATAVAVASDEPTPVRDLNPDVPEPVADLIHALLAKNAAQRPQPAAEVARMLRELERGGAPVVSRELTATAAPSAPQVVYVPIQVTAYEPGARAFENLDRDDPTATDVTDTPVKEPSVRPAPRPRFPWIAIAAVLIAIGIGATAYYFAKRKPAEVAGDPPKPGVTTAPPRTDPQREFARWVFERQGAIESYTQTFRSNEELPRGPISITGVSFALPGCVYAPSDTDVPLFAACPDLKRLQLRDVRFTDAGFAKLLVPLTERLEYLSLSAPDLSPAALTSLGNCKKLNTLHISRIPKLSGNLKFLAEIPNLWNFSTYGSDITNDDLEVLKESSLRGLVINDNKRITAAGLEHLAKSRICLGELNISGTGVTGRAGAEAIAKFTKLVSLTAATSALADDDVALFRPLIGLEILYLNDNGLTDGVAETLRDLPKLHTLLLIRTAFSDAGLKRLHNNKKLGFLQLEETKVTLAGVKSFQDAVPDCDVRFDYKPAEDPDRALAEWVLAAGGEVSVAVRRLPDAPAAPGVLDVKDATKLLPGLVRVVRVQPGPTTALTNADVARLRGCERVRRISSYVQTALTDDGFKALAELPQAAQFESLVLRSPKATGAGVAHLSKCPALHTLDVSGAELGDNTPDPPPAFPKLVSFTADGCKLTDAGIAKLNRRPLTWLSIPHNPAVSADAAVGVFGQNLAGCDLAFLDLEGTGADDKAALKAAQLVHLERLRLRNTAVTDAGLAALTGAKALKDLDVRGTKVTVVGAKRFKDARPDCSTFAYDYKPVEDPDRRLAEWLIGKGGSVNFIKLPQNVSKVADLPDGELRVSTAYGPGHPKPPLVMTDDDLDYFRDTSVYHFSMGTLHSFTDRGLDKFTQFPGAERITILSLASPRVTADGYKHLTRLKSLEQIHLEFIKVTDAQLAACCAVRTLKRINVSEGAITDAGMKHLTGLPLTFLELAYTGVGDTGLGAVAGAVGMEKLILLQTSVTNAGLVHLAGMTKLTWLDLANTTVTDDGMKHLVGLPALRRLNLSGTGLTNAGLKHLEGIKTLAELDIRGTKVTPEGLAAFKKARQDVNLK